LGGLAPLGLDPLEILGTQIAGTLAVVGGIADQPQGVQGKLSRSAVISFRSCGMPVKVVVPAAVLPHGTSQLVALGEAGELVLPLWFRVSIGSREERREAR
jgi:hypothetical protein